MLKQVWLILTALVLCAAPIASATELTPAERFVDPVSARSATLSPDGNFIAYIARTNSEQRIVVVDLASQQGRIIQAIGNANAYIHSVDWKGSDHLVSVISFRQNIEGRAATGTSIRSRDTYYYITRVVSMNRDGSNVVQMFENHTSQLTYGLGSTILLSTVPSDATHVLIAAQDRTGLSVYRADVTNGRTERIAGGDDQTVDYVTDGNDVPVIRIDRITDGSGWRYFRRAPGTQDWTSVFEVRRAATLSNSPDFEVVGSGPGAGQVYVLARQNNADLSSLYLYNTATGEFGQPLMASRDADAYIPWRSRRTNELFAACEFAQRLTCQARDAAMQRQLTAIDAFFNHEATVHLVDMSEDGGKWLLWVDGPTNPGAYYLYQVSAHQVTPIAALYPNQDPNRLSPTEVVNYQSRDGTSLWAYVTARAGVAGPRPTVVLPHGGPEARDEYGYDAFAQFLASRGYVVVQPNFRGGAGFGRAFSDAGLGQWGGRMQDDVTDAVRHMIEAGAADPRRICIVGASYGGYVALEGLSSTPDLYACAISIAGVSDLQLSLNSEGADGHWRENYQYWIRSIGSDRSSIAAHSPRLHADRITAPLLLIHGDEDETVPIKQSEVMQQAMNAAGHPTQLIRIPDENHYWDSWTTEHRLMVFQATEQFLAQHLGQAN